MAHSDPSSALRLRRGPAWTALALAAIALSTSLAPARADDVYLENGSSFEDVVIVETATHVVIELPIGRMRLPRHQVDRIVRRESPLERFRTERQRLLEDPQSEPAEWLRLARWAAAQGLEGRARDLALLVARWAPDLEGLTPVMQSLGYERVAGEGWLPLEQAMARRGLALHEGEWVPVRERDRLVAAQRAEEIRRQRQWEEERRRAEEERVSSNRVALASIELANEALDDRKRSRERRWPPRGRLVGSFVGGFVSPGALVVPGLPLSGGFPIEIDPETARAIQDHQARIQRDIQALSKRQPGSILPLSTFKHLDP